MRNDNDRDYYLLLVVIVAVAAIVGLLWALA